MEKILTELEIKEFKELITDNLFDVTILANASAYLASHIKDINWLGFYLLKNNRLLLGPFQGLVACTQISLNHGVCGFCASNKKSIIVDNVHEFKGHIACDSRSNSEICVPIIINDTLYGLLDIDSIALSRFSMEDQIILEEICKTIAIEIKKCQYQA